MEPAEISLLLLRHLARDGCVETIRTYVNECPAVMQSLTVAAGGHPDPEFLRQKLLNRSVNISLIDLLSEYGRAKSMIQDLVTKLLFEWKALSTYFLSPHDSMATQLAHITNLLESKCKPQPTDSKCVGTSDEPFVQFGWNATSTASVSNIVGYKGVDAAVQTTEDDLTECNNELPEEPDRIPTIMSSLLETPMIEKIVEIANKEKLNRSNPSENVLANNTETEIDKMLLDILHGMGGPTISNSALSLVNNNTDSMAPEQSAVDPQLMDLFQYAQSTIVHTPVPGTLVRPEDSVTKQRPCGSFLDLIDTPFKSAFMSVPNTPIGKVIPQEELQKTLEKPVQTVELDFGVSANLPPTPSKLNKPDVPLSFVAKPKTGPRYSIIPGMKPHVSSAMQDLQRIRRKRDITPRIPANIQLQPTPSEVVPNETNLVRSASKRKFNTPVKLSPVKALLAPTVNFYCPSGALGKVSSASKTDQQTGSIETPLKALSPTDFSTLATPQPRESSAAAVNSETSLIKSPLATINYDDLISSSSLVKPIPPFTTKPSVITKPTDSSSATTPMVLGEKSASVTMMTPDNLVDTSAPDAESDSPRPMYTRLLASVRHARPSSILLNKKSFSTPRKKGHIRNLLFKTPPSAHSERTENSSINFSDSLSTKRKATPSPPLGSKSKKRLKWNNLPSDNKQNTTSEESASVISNNSSLLSTTKSIVDIASKIVLESAVSTRSKSAKAKEANEKSTPKNVRQTRGSTSRNSSEKANVSGEPTPGPSIISPPPPIIANKKRSSKRLDDQRAADAVVMNAVPLGSRIIPGTSKIRITRGKSRAASEQNPITQSSNVWMTQAEVKNEEPIPSHACFGDLANTDSAPKGISLNAIVTSSSDKTKVEPVKLDESQRTPNVSSSLESTTSASDSSDVVVGISLSQKVEHEKIPKVSEASKTLASAAKECEKIKLKTIKLVSSTGILKSGKPITTVPAVNMQVRSRTDKAYIKPSGDGGNGSVKDKPTREIKPVRTPCSPGRGRPRSPKKSPSKNTRRILPKPVPPDYPRTVFPPPSQPSGYILSIPSSSPARDNDDSLLNAFISPVTILSETPAKKPSLTLSSSDSSLEFNTTVPKTPRLKADSGEDTTLSRLFPSLRNDSMSTTGAGIPIFSSTPLKSGPPETPGKSLAVVGGAVINEGDSSTRTSLFDTPIKVDSPPKSILSLQCNSNASVVDKVTSKSVDFSLSVSEPVANRRSPRKANSPFKTRVKTPRKAKTPMKSVQKLPPKHYEYKPIRRTPYKSPLSKKFNDGPIAPKTPEEENSSTPIEVVSPTPSPSKSVSKSNIVSPFESLFTKSRSFMRLSEVARRGRGNLGVNSGQSFTSPQALPMPSSCTATDSFKSKEDKRNPKTIKSPDVHFQFAVSGRTKQLSLSEHESLLGLLQIGHTKTQHKKQSHLKMDADLLRNIDLHNILRTVHAGD